MRKIVHKIKYGAVRPPQFWSPMITLSVLFRIPANLNVANYRGQTLVFNIYCCDFPFFLKMLPGFSGFLLEKQAIIEVIGLLSADLSNARHGSPSGKSKFLKQGDAGRIFIQQNGN